MIINYFWVFRFKKNSKIYREGNLFTTTPLFNKYLKAPVIRVCIEAGIDVSAKDNKGRIALFYCTEPEVAKLLIDAGIDMSIQDNKGKTALFYCKNGDIMKMLITAGIDVSIKDNTGQIAFPGLNKVKSVENKQIIHEQKQICFKRK